MKARLAFPVCFGLVLICATAFAQYGPSGYGGGMGGGYSPPGSQVPGSPYGGSGYGTPDQAQYGSTPSPQPSIPTYTAPQYQTEYVMECQSCHKAVPNNSKVGDKCPHCGVKWTTYDNGNGTTSSSRASTIGGIGGGVAAIFAVLAVLARIGFRAFLHNQ